MASPGQMSAAGSSPVSGLGQALGSPSAAVPASAVEGPHEGAVDWLVLAAVWLACAAYMAACLKRGWVPHDGGALGQMAERVLQGQVPHRDFGEFYTGGLTYLNALAFRLWGINCFSLRIPLFLFFLGWIPAIYFIGRRFVGPLAAGTITLLAEAWSVPNYPEAMPSWYNLFFTTWGTLALLRYGETEKRRWLWIGGLCGGLSFLVKITGLYFIAAALLFLVLHEQCLSGGEYTQSGLRAPAEARSTYLPRRRKRGWGYRVFVLVCLLAFVSAVARLVGEAPVAHRVFYFILPSACLAGLLAWSEWQMPLAQGAARFRRLMGIASPFVGGALAPVGVFLCWYARVGAMQAWFEGTFVLPAARFRWTVFSLPPPRTALALAPMAAVLLFAYFKKELFGRFTGPAVIAGLGTLLVLARWWKRAYVLLGVSPPTLVPLAGLALILLAGRAGGLRGEKQQRTFLIVSVAAVCSLIQFPLGLPTYFCYVAPLVLLACVALASVAGQFDRMSVGALFAFYLAFAVWLHTPGYFTVMGGAPGRPASLRALNLPRAGGIEIDAAEAAEYEGLAGLIRAHARGNYIYAGPGSPEVYFLTGFRNPTESLLDFLDRDFEDGPERARRILGDLDAHSVSVVALRVDSEYAGPIPPQLRAGLESRFPRSALMGGFEVRWK